MESVFIHGLGQNASSFNKTISCMGESIHVICPDLADMMNLKKAVYDNLYSAFVEYCENISAPFSLCGLSLGAVLALNYAIDYPSKVNSLVLIAGQYKMPKALLKIQNMIFRFMPEASFQQTGFKKKDFIKLTSSMSKLDFKDNLKDIACDVLIVCGEKDHANRKAANEMAEYMPNAEIQIIQKAGHELNKEVPEKLAGILDCFYKEQEI